MVAGIASLLIGPAACTKAHDPPLPECEPPGGPEGALQTSGHWPPGAEALALTVVEAESDRIRLEADPDRDYSDEGFLELRFGVVPEGTLLPRFGDELEALPWGVCELLAYARLQAADGAIAFEGGDPNCLTGADRALWEPGPFFQVGVPTDPQACQEQGCPSEPREITISTDDGAPSVLAVGQSRELAIDGRPYLAVAQYARLVDYASCGQVVDGEGMTASAFLAPLAE